MRAGWMIVGCWALLVATVAGQLRADPAPPASLQLEDRIEPLVPLHPKTEADRNEIEALSLFAAGRAEWQQGRFTAALRLYQRALQHDPKSLPILREIIDVARGLNRMSEYMRYATIAVELDPSNLQLLFDLAAQLAEHNDFEGALKLYLQARAKTDKGTVPYLAMTMHVGRLSYVTGHMKDAADAFGEVMAALAKSKELGLTPTQVKTIMTDETRSYELFGAAFLATNRLDEASQAYDKLEELSPHKASHAFHRAEIYTRRKQYDQALSELQGYFDAKETREEQAPYELLDTVLTATGRQSELLERLSKLHQADPDNVHLDYYLAAQYRRAGKYAEAQPLYEELLKHPPQLEAYRGLVEVYRHTRQAKPLFDLLAGLVAKTGSIELLEKESKAIAADRDLYDKLVPLARARRQAGDDASFGGNLTVASLAMEAKDYALAGECFDAALKARPGATPELLLLWGLGLLAADQPAAAVPVFRRGVDEKVVPSDNPVFHTYLAMSLELCGLTDQALQVGQKAASLAGDSPRVLSRVGWILYHAKRYDAAAKSYRDFIRKFDDDFKDESVRRLLKEARMILSNICVTQKDVPQAEEWIEQVLDEFPDDIGALNDLGYLWADQGKNLERALKMIQQAVAAEPDNYAYRDSLGWVFFKLGRYPEAIAELKQAASEEGVDGVVIEHLGDAYEANRQPSEAKTAWRDAIRALEKQGEREKIAGLEAKLRRLSPDSKQEAPPKAPRPPSTKPAAEAASR